MPGKQQLVVKIGTSSVTTADGRVDLDAVTKLASDVADVRDAGHEVIVVTSGAITAGVQRLGVERPTEPERLQALSAVGQIDLMASYRELFAAHGMVVGQVLIAPHDFRDRDQYLHARATFHHLLDLGVVPVVNENDTVSTQELQLGDNDTLAATVANLVEADLLVVLTDQHGLYDKNPDAHADAALIDQAAVEDAALDAYAGEGQGRLGRGGMRTKIEAARAAARGGAHCLIAHGAEPDILRRIAAGEVCGTLLLARDASLSARRQWIAAVKSCGALHVDSGAERALRTGKSLLPVGVTEVGGSFRSGDVVAVVTARGDEIARGIVNYAAEDARRIQGRRSQELEGVLGVVGEPELIHRDNLCPLWEGAGA